MYFVFAVRGGWAVDFGMHTLKIIVLGVVLSLLALAGPAGCNDETEDELNATLKAMMDAGTRRDADAFVAMVCPDSLDRYTQTVRMAWNGKADHVRQLPTGEFVEVVWIRHTMEPEAIKSATAIEVLRTTVESGFYSYDEPDFRMFIKNAKLSGNGKRATADLVFEFPRHRDTQKVAFSRGDRGWRIETDSLIDANGRFLDRLLKRRDVNLDRETATALILEEETGSMPRRDILRVPPSEM